MKIFDALKSILGRGAPLELGVCRALGKGVQIDCPKAIELIKQVAQLGNKKCHRDFAAIRHSAALK